MEDIKTKKKTSTKSAKKKNKKKEADKVSYHRRPENLELDAHARSTYGKDSGRVILPFPSAVIRTNMHDLRVTIEAWFALVPTIDNLCLSSINNR